MRDMDNLRIVVSKSSSQEEIDAPDTSLGNHSDGAERISQVDSATDPTDSIMTDESASLEDRIMDSPPRVLAENSSKANQGTAPEEFFSMDLCDVPETPSKSGRLKRPSGPSRRSPIPSPILKPILPQKRKRGNVFDFQNGDEEEKEMQQENTNQGNAHMYSIPFTPINRRQPMQLGDLEETSLNSILPPLEDVPPGRGAATIFGHNRLMGRAHDGPLKSKLNPSREDAQGSSKRPRGNGKYPFCTTHATTPQEYSLPLSCESQSAIPQTPRQQRRPTAFDWEEHRLFFEASTANKSFRSAKALALSVERRRAEKTADLSDSIRTAHE